MLAIVEGGFNFSHPEGLEIMRPEGTEFYVFVYYRTPAEVYLQEDWKNCENCCVLFPPDEPHHYRSRGEGYVNDWLHIVDHSGFLPSIGIPFGTLIRPVDTANLLRSMQNTNHLAYTDSPWRNELADAELKAMFYRLSAEIMHPTASEVPSCYAGVLSEIRSGLYGLPSAAASVPELAALAGLSVSYFQALYKKQFGLSVGEDIIRSRLERACYLLRNSTHTVSEVAGMSGYGSEAHFIRQFKRFLGNTPGRFRSAK